MAGIGNRQAVFAEAIQDDSPTITRTGSTLSILKENGKWLVFVLHFVPFEFYINR